MKKYYGVGTNDVKHSVAVTGYVGGKRVNKWLCPYHQTWKTILQRCYSPRYQEKSANYVGCRVDEAWHSLSCFENWMKLQPYHDEWLAGQNIQVDKDFSGEGNLVYGPNTCILVPSYINTCLSPGTSSGKEYPGVSKHKNKFQAKVHRDGKRKHLGLFSTQEEAYRAWKNEKLEILKSVLKRYVSEGKPDSRVIAKIIKQIEEWENK